MIFVLVGSVLKFIKNPLTYLRKKIRSTEGRLWKNLSLHTGAGNNRDGVGWWYFCTLCVAPTSVSLRNSFLPVP